MALPLSPHFRVLATALLALALLQGCPRKPDPAPRAKDDAAPARPGRASPPGGTPIPPPPPPVSVCLKDLPTGGEVPAWERDADASGNHGVVTSVDASASRAGIDILEAGGNAVDAAVATALALAVTHPSAGNLGGGGFMTLKVKTLVETIDFRENSPAALTDEAFWKMIKKGGRGGASVGVPGTVAGLYLAHERHGKLPWSRVVEPALRLATDGYEIGERQAKTVVWAQVDLRRDEVAKSVFFPKGKPVEAGTRIKRPRLAIALRRIMDEGLPGFYEGPTADDLIASLGPDGLMTLDDLKTYRAVVRQPLCFDFAGLRIIAPPAPSAGGVALTQTLLMLQELGVSKTGPNTVERLHLFAEASRRAQAERQLFVVAPDSLTEAEQLAQKTRALSATTWLDPHPVDVEKATRSSDIHPSYAKALSELDHTTHLSVIDADGNLVSLTVTLSGSYGARIFTKETGIALNNSTASFSSVGVNTPHAGRRTTSSMAPTLALLGKEAALVLGSPGGNTIPSTVSQLILGLALDKRSLKEVVEAPRVHQTFAPGDLTTEHGKPLDKALQLGLTKKGHKVSVRRSAIGDANTAGRTFDVSFAVCDPREGGAALAAEEAQAADSQD